MPALNPTYTANYDRDGISEYLTTTFSLAEPATADRLKDFLLSPGSSMFYGPYVRTRLPYAPATDWEGILDFLPSWFQPYRHQAEAFRRLGSQVAGQPHTPEPTLVVTGTGSGKTESFLFPILDHCRRNPGPGVKALILYPMNALANDQERRLAKLLMDHPEYKGIRAGVYTGEDSDNKRTTVSEAGLISDRTVMRQSPPDILLTNYKMLDQLLLRDADREIWKRSAHTLQYLALDEFHTYDAAQGTDVAMLLRRLGLQLKRFQAPDFLTPEQAALPLGKITPVATSATLGGGSADGVQDMLDFAFTVFGQRMTADALVGETLLTFEQWRSQLKELVGQDGAPSGMPDRALAVSINKQITDAVAAGSTYDDAVHATLCEELFGCSTDLDAAIAAYAHNELVQRVLETCARPIELAGADGLVSRVLPADIARLPEEGALQLITHILTEVAYLRSRFGERNGWLGKKLPGVETHLWVRGVSHVDRAVDTVATDAMFRWSDDGQMRDGNWLPAIYCRHCGRSGWMVAMQAGDAGLEVQPQKIRRYSIHNRTALRPLIDATREDTEGMVREENTGSQLVWLDLNLPAIVRDRPSEAQLEKGGVVPVLMYQGDDKEEMARRQVCPSCGEYDAISYVGSAVATLLSVAISNLFGLDELDAAEKKTLVFTDSVQDAAHRAGFVQARARTFALRTRQRRALQANGTLTVDEFAVKIMEAADAEANPQRARFELLPPQLAEKSRFAPYWAKGRAKGKAAAERDAEKRLAFDTILEFGLRSDLPRSLVSSGAATAAVDVSTPVLTEVVEKLPVLDPQDLVAWARGIVEYIRVKGGITHPLLESYIKNDCNAYLLARPQAREKGVPKFARGGTPKFPRKGKLIKYDEATITVGSPRGWFTSWTKQVLGINAHEAAHLVSELLDRLADRGVLSKVETASKATIYCLEPQRVRVETEPNPAHLECAVCSMHLGVDASGRALLEGLPCFTNGCNGHFAVVEIKPNYYRTMYEATHPRTVVAKEHTSLLEDSYRREIEDNFKAQEDKQAANAPNVLVATPTLEMGIDIGDLSTVMLSSLPKTVANYVQRVGRAGRLSGNSLAMAFAQGRGQNLMKLENPIETIGGKVQAPAAYLSARDIMRRQFLAYLIDRYEFQESGTVMRPQKASSLFKSSPSLLDALSEQVEQGLDGELDVFCATLAAHTRPEVLEELRQWVSDELISDLQTAKEQWRVSERQLVERLNELREAERTLEIQANSIAADDDVVAQHRSTLVAQRFARTQLQEMRDEYWIAALERFGLLPNFTLFDDSVEFDISIERTDELGESAHEIRSYSRSVASALYEFAPGNTFYVQGVAATIDSVELGQDNAAIVQWRLCPKCSYSEVVAPDADTSVGRVCPRCGIPQFADQGQIIDVVEMTKVYSTVDENRAAIDGTRDERSKGTFQSALSFVVPDGTPTEQWYLNGTGFGVQYLPKVEMRWLNLGPRTHGMKKIIADQEVEASLFRVCKYCGHLDSEAGSNDWRDHRRWCRHRNATKEESITFALGRHLSTQGVLMHLPQLVVAKDAMTLPSLTAAIRLGFKEHLGGDPSHLDVSVVRGVERGAVSNMLLLHDAIPGGTGYLANFTAWQDIRGMLEKVYVKLRDCSCAETEQEVCSACLLPFARGEEITEVSREAALAAIGKILADDVHPDTDADPLEVDWKGHISAEQQAEVSSRSELESRLIPILREALEEKGAKITERTVNGSMQWTFTFPGGVHRWKMEEQKDFQFTRPDFYFSTDDPTVRPIALYLDGAEYHISESHNRVAGDIEKRNKLHERGIIPWSITWADLDRFQAIGRGEPVEKPIWFNPDFADLLAGPLTIRPGDMVLDPLTHLRDQLVDPVRDRGNLVLAVGATAAKNADIYFGGSYHNAVYVNSELELTLQLGSGGVERESWNTFLQLADIFYLRESGITIAVEDSSTPQTAGVEEPEPVTAPAQATEQAPEVSGAWQTCLAEYEGDEDALPALEVLAHAGIAAPADIGEEVGGLSTIATWQEPKVLLVYPEEAEDFTGIAAAAAYQIIEADAVDEELTAQVWGS